ncbi:MAG: hypothetical protein K8J08_12085 [Thermoanaerobaculia bacterium]|nr:hypothetical protein [Thermoanaerobaculia bacterium]
MTTDKRALASLLDLGLNQLEAEVYVHLLGGPPLTAYAVGRALGKATANVYKAVESLARQGAVLVEEGEPRLCRAVSPEVFFAAARRSLDLRTRAAEVALADIEVQAIDERIYRVEDVDALFERCERMLDSATMVAILDVFPACLERIRGAAIRAADRGVDVRIQLYRQTEVPGCDIVLASTGETSIEHWGSEQLNLVVDGREVLLALLSSNLDRIHQALWSRSLYLACLIHSGRLSEQTVHRIRSSVVELPAESPIRRALARHAFFVDGAVPGQLELHQRFSTSRGLSD